MPKNLIILLLLACGLVHCTDNIDLGNDMSREYYPVEVGDYWVYDMSETTIRNQFLQDVTDSITYQVRERVDTVFRDQTGELTYLVIRSKRVDASQPWDQDSVITINKSASDLRYTRDNLKTVRLVFPLAENKKWNGNAFNSREPEEYSLSQVGQPFTLGDTTYNNTARVVQAFNENLVELDDRHEVYAQGVGLVYKRTIDFDFCRGGEGQNCQVGQNYVIYGRRIFQTLNSFGHQE